MRRCKPKGARTRIAAATLWVLGVATTGLLLGCQPSDERPGLGIPGEVAEEHVQDWSFTDGVEEIFIETRTWYGIPHATTIWCVALGGNLYIGSYGEGHKYWEKNVARKPEARVSIDGVIYEVRVDPVTDSDLVTRLDEALNRKYDMEATFGDEDPPWWFYRLNQR